jgi:hypothetical protein
VRWLLTQARELGEARLPRPFRHLLERHLPPQALPSLGRHALESWLSVKGKTGAAWMLSLIAEYGGDEAVTTLCRQIDAWRRHQKPKANTAIRALGRMGTVFALSQLERIASAGGRYTESLVQNAREGLAEAAAARGLTPEQLREELVPDLGLTLEGLVADLGPRRLRVKVRADLSLEVHHEGGRVTQSFPALRKDEDPVKHAEGKQRFDVLRKNLQPVLKAQLARLEEVLFVQDDYPRERWQRLFPRHPVLRLGIQPVLWSRLTPTGEVVGSFRVAEDGTLVDAQNAEVRLHPSERVGLWHPVLEDARTHALWEEHLADYRLVQPFRQLQREALRPTDAERGATAMTRFQGVSLWASRLRNTLERLGCRAPVGEHGMLHEHARALPNHGVAFRVLHSPIQRQFELEERVELGRLEYTLEPRYRRRHGLAQEGQPTLGELPPVLCACLLDVMRSLALQSDTP